MKFLRRIYDKYLVEPMQHVSAGDLPEGFKDATVTRTKLRFGWRAKLGFLLGCELEVTTVVYCENPVGRTESKIGLWVYDPTRPPSKTLGMAEYGPMSRRLLEEYADGVAGAASAMLNVPHVIQSGQAFPGSTIPPGSLHVRYTCPECHTRVLTKNETEGVTRRQIDCPVCEYEGAVDGVDVGLPIFPAQFGKRGPWRASGADSIYPAGCGVPAATELPKAEDVKLHLDYKKE